MKLEDVSIYPLSFLFLLVVLGCAPKLDTAVLTSEERGYMEEVKLMPTTFIVSKEQADEVWARGQGFIGKYSGMKIQVATDSHIGTYNPTSSHSYYGYSLNKMLIGDEVEFQVICTQSTNLGTSGQVAMRNAQILAYFMKTGIKYDSFINKEF